jgi:hypothetical protein
MHTIEFETKIENGMIPIPLLYKDRISDTVRVIVFSGEKPASEPVKRIKKKIHYIGIAMKDYQFNREEANERR